MEFGSDQQGLMYWQMDGVAVTLHTWESGWVD